MRGLGLRRPICRDVWTAKTLRDKRAKTLLLKKHLLLKNIMMPQMFDYSFKRLLFSRSWHYTGINECSFICKMLQWSHKYWNRFLFFYNNYAFVLMTKLLTQIKINASPGNEGWKVYLAFLRLTVNFSPLRLKDIYKKSRLFQRCEKTKQKTKQNKTKQNKTKGNPMLLNTFQLPWARSKELSRMKKKKKEEKKRL